MHDLDTLGVLAMVVNVYDQLLCPPYPVHTGLSVRYTHVRGMKAAFWRQELGDVGKFDYVWLFDADVRPYVPQLSLQYLERWFQGARAGVLQPSIIRATSRARASDWPQLIAADFSEECAALCFSPVEQMTPMFTANVWATFHRRVLRSAPTNLLNTTVWGLGNAWSGIAHSMNLTSLVLKDTFVVHDDTRTYDRLLVKGQRQDEIIKIDREAREREGQKLKVHLRHRHPELMADPCRHRKVCFRRPMAS